MALKIGSNICGKLRPVFIEPELNKNNIREEDNSKYRKTADPSEPQQVWQHGAHRAQHSDILMLIYIIYLLKPAHIIN